LAIIDIFAFRTTLFSESARKQQLLTLVEAIYVINEKPARFLGLREGGRLSTRWFEDNATFDTTTIGTVLFTPITTTWLCRRNLLRSRRLLKSFSA